MDYSFIPATALLIIMLIMGFFRLIAIRRSRNSKMQIFQLHNSLESIDREVKDLIINADFKVMCDIVVQQLNREPLIYITLLDKDIKKFKRQIALSPAFTNLSESDGHIMIYGSEKTDVFVSEITFEEFNEVKFSHLNFSEVNEIGESVALRFYKSAKSNMIRCDVILTAPTEFQLNEILKTTTNIFTKIGDTKIMDVKQFILDFNSGAILRK